MTLALENLVHEVDVAENALLLVQLTLALLEVQNIERHFVTRSER